MVNITCKLKTDEPYVLASQVKQVYYVRDIYESNWLTVVKMKPRDLDEPCQENENFALHFRNLLQMKITM